MRWLVPVLVGVLACAPKRPKTVVKIVEEPKLDIVAPWLDPAGFWPRGTPVTQQPLSAALADPGTAPIVIRGATILTATGQRFDQGTVVIDKGTLRFIGAGDPPDVPAGAVEIDGKGKFVTP